MSPILLKSLQDVKHNTELITQCVAARKGLVSVNAGRGRWKTNRKAWVCCGGLQINQIVIKEVLSMTVHGNSTSKGCVSSTCTLVRVLCASIMHVDNAAASLYWQLTGETDAQRETERNNMSVQRGKDEKGKCEPKWVSAVQTRGSLFFFGPTLPLSHRDKRKTDYSLNDGGKCKKNTDSVDMWMLKGVSFRTEETYQEQNESRDWTLRYPKENRSWLWSNHFTKYSWVKFSDVLIIGLNSHFHFCFVGFLNYVSLLITLSLF